MTVVRNGRLGWHTILRAVGPAFAGPNTELDRLLVGGGLCHVVALGGRVFMLRAIESVRGRRFMPAPVRAKVLALPARTRPSLDEVAGS